MNRNTGSSIRIPWIVGVVMRTVMTIRRNPERMREILKLAGIGKGMKVLDYGCGIGGYTVEAARLVTESGSAIGADCDARMLGRLKKYARNLPGVTPLLVNSPEDIKNTDFDSILLLDVLHLMKDKTGTIDTLLLSCIDNRYMVVSWAIRRNPCLRDYRLSSATRKIARPLRSYPAAVPTKHALCCERESSSAA